MKRLLLFAGLPGVGKSTISRGISKETGATVVDIDDFKKTDVDPDLVAKEIDPPELRWSYYLKALAYVFGLFDQGTSIVIMDEVFHLGSLRAQLEDFCTKQDVRVSWIEVRCPYEIVERRLRSIRREGHILSTEEALRMHLLFEGIFERFPCCSQNHIVVDNGDEIDTALLTENILKISQ